MATKKSTTESAGESTRKRNTRRNAPSAAAAATAPATVTASTIEIKTPPAIPDLEQVIRTRAYQLFEQRGFQHGRDLEDWLRAETEILAQYNSTGSAKRPVVH